MATRRAAITKEDLDEAYAEEELYGDEPMALAKEFTESLTVAIPVKEEEHKEQRVTVYLPKLIGDDDGIAVDQYEHVTIANERGEVCYKVLRGEYVDVPISVFIVLKQKYPKL